MEESMRDKAVKVRPVRDILKDWERVLTLVGKGGVCDVPSK